MICYANLHVNYLLEIIKAPHIPGFKQKGVLTFQGPPRDHAIYPPSIWLTFIKKTRSTLRSEAVLFRRKKLTLYHVYTIV